MSEEKIGRTLLAKRLLGFIKKDIGLFLSDRQAVVLSLVVPILIASILGWLDSSASGDSPSSPMVMDVVDFDQSLLTKAIKERLVKGKSVMPVEVTEAAALGNIKEGKVAFAVIFPKEFGTMANEALLGQSKKPTLEMVTDPSKPMEIQIAKAALFEQGSAAIMGIHSDSLEAPFESNESHRATPQTGKWASAAHDYAGFGLQGLLFFAMEAAVGLARERRQGIWKRLRAAPVSLSLILLSRALSSAVVALAIIVAMFGMGGLLFGIRITGSTVGFGMICLATSLMASAFGLLITTIGKTETQSRGISILLILVMLATGGAWFPMQKMPVFIQHLAEWLPVRWAIDGFDAMTWRGLGLMEASRSALVLTVFAVVFTSLALLRLRSARYQD